MLGRVDGFDQDEAESKRDEVLIRRECIGVIETFRCELIGCNISCSRCHKKAPGSLMMPGVCCESLPQLA